MLFRLRSGARATRFGAAGTGTFRIEANLALLLHVTALAVKMTVAASSYMTSAADRRPDGPCGGLRCGLPAANRGVQRGWVSGAQAMPTSSCASSCAPD